MKCRFTSSKKKGMSLPEIITVVGVVGLLASAAIPAYKNCFGSSQAAVAGNTLETLNAAVHSFNEVNYELKITAAASGGANELAILHTLQYRKSTNPSLGSPYVDPKWSPTISSSSNDYRATWSGTLYTMLTPGQTGTGIKMTSDSSEYGTSYSYPANYTTAGH